VVRVIRVSTGLADGVESRCAAAILGRRVPLTRDVAQTAQLRIVRAHAGDGDPMFSTVPKVVEVVDRGLARPQDMTQPGLGG
jgi:hypothetical protein